MKQVGVISEKIINELKLDIIANTPIYVGENNEEHIKNRHPVEYDIYFNRISDIISEPDYIGINPKDKSIQYVKEYVVNSEFIRVAVKITSNKKCYVKTLHLLSTVNAENYIRKGTLIKLDK